MAATLALTSRAHEYYTLSRCETVPKSQEFEPFFPKRAMGAMRRAPIGNDAPLALRRLEIIEPLSRSALGKLEPVRQGERPRLTRANLCEFVVSRTAQEL